MGAIWLLGFVIPAIFAFIATSGTPEYPCPDCHKVDDMKTGYNGYDMCMNCGWLEGMSDD